MCASRSRLLALGGDLDLGGEATGSFDSLLALAFVLLAKEAVGDLWNRRKMAQSSCYGYHINNDRNMNI